MAKPKITKIVNNYRCFTALDYFIIGFVIIIALMPFIDIILYQFSIDYTVINHDEYSLSLSDFGNTTVSFEDDNILLFNSSNYQFTLNGTNVVNNFNITTQRSTFPVPRDGDFNFERNITFITTDYTFNKSNPDDNLSFITQYEFDRKKIYTYYPTILKLPIKALGKWEYTRERDPSGVEFTFPSHWDSFWNNFEYIFYYVDDNNQGIAFNYGRNVTENNIPRQKTYSTYFGDLQLSIYDLNVSSEQGIRDDDGTIRPTFTLHNNKMEDNSLFNQYLNLLGSTGDNIAEDGFFEGNIDIFGLDISLTQRKGLFYDYSMFEVGQLDGYPSKADFPIIYASKCGIILNINEEFDSKPELLTEYGEEIVELSGIKQFYNGIEINDDTLFLGKMLSMKDKLNKIIIYDIVILGIYISIVAILVWQLEIIPKYKEYQQKKTYYCNVDYSIPT